LQDVQEAGTHREVGGLPCLRALPAPPRHAAAAGPRHPHPHAGRLAAVVVVARQAEVELQAAAAAPPPVHGRLLPRNAWRHWCASSSRAEVARRVREAPRERRLDLLGMALMGLPAGLGKQLPMLSALLVNTNSIRTLPDSVGELRALERLNARFNVLGALPATIGLLGQLLSLDVRRHVELPLTATDGH
jgi:hypothetical protein